MSTKVVNPREVAAQEFVTQTGRTSMPRVAPGNEQVPSTLINSTAASAGFPDADTYNRIIEKAVTNPYYRQRLTSDPRTVLKEAGVTVPPGIEVRVRPLEEQTRYIFLPPAEPSVAHAIEVTKAINPEVATENGQEAVLNINWWSGIVLTLEHDEVQTILSYITTGQDIADFLKSLGLPIPALAFTVIAYYLRIQAALIGSLDRGSGVYLTLPWPAVWWQQWWLIIPGPR